MSDFLRRIERLELLLGAGRCGERCGKCALSDLAQTIYGVPPVECDGMAVTLEEMLRGLTSDRIRSPTDAA